MSKEIDNKTLSNQDDFNQKLIEAREKMGLSSRDIANELKISDEKIVSIESKNTQEIPSVYLRVYIRSYAALVGIDSAETEQYLSTLLSNKPRIKEKSYLTPEKKQRKDHKFFWSSVVVIAVIIVSVLAYNSYQDKKESDRVEIGRFEAKPPTPRS